MKPNKNELNVDFIGVQEPLTKEEETIISEFIMAQKIKKNKKADKNRWPANQPIRVGV
jgi:hypothetical protein